MRQQLDGSSTRLISGRLKVRLLLGALLSLSMFGGYGGADVGVICFAG